MTSLFVFWDFLCEKRVKARALRRGSGWLSTKKMNITFANIAPNRTALTTWPADFPKLESDIDFDVSRANCHVHLTIKFKSHSINLSFTFLDSNVLCILVDTAELVHACTCTVFAAPFQYFGVRKHSMWRHSTVSIVQITTIHLDQARISITVATELGSWVSSPDAHRRQRGQRVNEWCYDRRTTGLSTWRLIFLLRRLKQVEMRNGKWSRFALISWEPITPKSHSAAWTWTLNVEVFD